MSRRNRNVWALFFLGGGRRICRVAPQWRFPPWGGRGAGEDWINKGFFCLPLLAKVFEHLSKFVSNVYCTRLALYEAFWSISLRNERRLLELCYGGIWYRYVLVRNIRINEQINIKDSSSECLNIFAICAFCNMHQA